MIKTLLNNNRLKLALSVLFIATVFFAIFSTIKYSRPTFVSLKCQKKEKEWLNKRDFNQVLYIDGCFVPQKISITKNNSIIFTNKSDTPMWIVSNNKPEKSYMANFSTGQNLGKDQNYAFVFETLGSFGYHNKTQPDGNSGYVIVKE